MSWNWEASFLRREGHWTRVDSIRDVSFLGRSWYVRNVILFVQDAYTAPYFDTQTSLNMPGFSITLLLLPRADEANTPSSDLILSLLDDHTDIPAWKWTAGMPPVPVSSQTIPAEQVQENQGDIRRIATQDPAKFVESIKRACNALIAAEPDITHMDSIAGDGDCGLTLKVIRVLLLG